MRSTRLLVTAVRRFLGCLCLVMGVLCAGVTAAQETSPLALLQAQDVRLAQIAERQLAANAQLCPGLMPLTGMILHSRDQYSAPAIDPLFANGAIAVAALVPGGVAEQAGVRAGDGVLSVNGIRLALLEPGEGAPLRDAVFELLADQPMEEPLQLVLSREGEQLQVVLDAPPGCRALVEIVTGGGLMGRSDGRVIQISFDLASLLADDELAVIFAHELSHMVLDHRARLVAAGVSKGMLGEFGRNRRLNRQVEVEADRMSVHLLANAGYEAEIAPRFWKSAHGARAGGGLMRSAIYPSPVSRADLIATEVANYIPNGRGPSWPGHLLALRHDPF